MMIIFVVKVIILIVLVVIMTVVMVIMLLIMVMMWQLVVVNEGVMIMTSHSSDEVKETYDNIVIKRSL